MSQAIDIDVSDLSLAPTDDLFGAHEFIFGEKTEEDVLAFDPLIHMGQIVVGKVGRDDGVYIGRPSVYGNPYRVGGSLRREDAIALYQSYLNAEMTIPSSRLCIAVTNLSRRVSRGENVVLVCYCEPAACHGDIIVDKVLTMATEILMGERAL